MFWNLLTSAGGSTEKQNPWSSLIFMGLLIAAMVVMMIFSRRSQKKRQEEMNKMLDAVQAGNKVKTIGGICGVVVEVLPEENAFVLETGSEAHGKTYIKFDKQAVYQTDAKPVEETQPEQTTEA
jgi:preprotein translocase YajC subunit